MSDKSIKPYAVIGAGQLTASLYKSGDAFTGFEYRFNLVRLERKSGRLVQWYRPADVVALLKLLRVLSAELDHDGCMNTSLRRQLRRISNHVDELLDDLKSDEITKGGSGK